MSLRLIFIFLSCSLFLQTKEYTAVEMMDLYSVRDVVFMMLDSLESKGWFGLYFTSKDTLCRVALQVFADVLRQR